MQTLEVSNRVHVRWDGVGSNDLDMQDLGLTVTSSERDVKLAVANALDRNLEDLSSLVVTREAGNLILRPAAVYG